MKSFRVLLLILAIVALLSNCKKNDSLSTANLIANYPLTNDNIDQTDLNGPMQLVNAPFQNGGIYCNGQYEYSPVKDFCSAITPSINKLNFHSFSISMDFLVTAYKSNPVWVIGRSCRWLAYYLAGDSTVEMLYNNSNYLTTKTKYSINTWHNGKISFDETTTVIFLDGNPVGALKFGNGYVPLDYDLCGTSDNEIGVTNFSNGEVFEGYVKNLRVYSPL